MATAAVQLPSHSRVEPGSHSISAATYPKPLVPKVDAEKIATEWLASFNAVLNSGNFNGLSKIFHEESYWRDQLCLSWDYHCLKGPEKMIDFIKAQKKGCRIKRVDLDKTTASRGPNVAPVDFKAEIMGVQSFLTVETDVGKGRGLVRLLPDGADGGKWKAFTLFTATHELKEHKESTGHKRPNGVSHGSQPGRKNWLEQRTELENFEGDLEPTCLVIGAGQGGLSAAARLTQLGIETLIIDRNDRIGDNWRLRYHQLVLHDPCWYDSLPYVPFPPNWPVFTPKDKLADWFESYAKILELNVWMKTTITDSKWDSQNRKWTVTLESYRNGKKEIRILHPRHVIQCTGHSGEAKFPSHIPGIDTFKGDNLVHSSQHKGAKKDGKGKNAIVVGCCNSGHDIAQDYFEHGYNVTMVQRSSTYVMSSEVGLDVLLGGLYCEDGPPLEDADVIFMSMPNALLKRNHVDATAEIARRDAPLLDGLRKAGFKLDTGPDDSGFFMKYFQRGGGYYIDVGASKLIIDGKIKIKQGQEIKSVNAHSLTFADDTELPADEIVFATGYQNMRGTAKKIFGEELSEQVKDVWGFDSEGELRTMWRRTGHPGFWFFGGNLGLCRYYSRMLAIQIKAIEEGLMKYDDQ